MAGYSYIQILNIRLHPVMCAVLYADSLYSSNGSNEQVYFHLQVTSGKKNDRMQQSD